MAQLKTDEWPEDGEQTTTEAQIEDLSPEQSILNGAADEQARRGEETRDGAEKLRNVEPDQAID